MGFILEKIEEAIKELLIGLQLIPLLSGLFS